MTLSDLEWLSKFSTTRRVARPHCDCWASCYKMYFYTTWWAGTWVFSKNRSWKYAGVFPWVTICRRGKEKIYGYTAQLLKAAFLLVYNKLTLRHSDWDIMWLCLVEGVLSDGLFIGVTFCPGHYVQGHFVRF